MHFEALLTAARESAHPCDFALVAMLGPLGLRIFEGTAANIADLGEEHGHRVLRKCGKGTKIVLIPLPPAVGRVIDRAEGSRACGPVLLNAAVREAWEETGLRVRAGDVIGSRIHLLAGVPIACVAATPTGELDVIGG